VRAGKLDCPQDNPFSKRAWSFELAQVLALFLYSVVNWAFCPAWFFIRYDCQSVVLPELQKFVSKITFLSGKSDFIR
jgi:hypothetical protein